ncbi:MAG: thermonuclease family protein [Bdellovibrionales bacterium]
MRIGLLLIGLLLVAGLAGAEEEIPEIFSASCSHTSQAFNCVEFLRNYDGDTFTINIPSVHPLIGKQITVRISGIDTPEMEGGSSCERRAAQRAQLATERMLRAARRINLRNIQRDKYFRVLADVEVDGVAVAGKLLKMGLAVPYDGGHKNPVNWCD